MADPAALLLDLDNTVYAYAPCHEAGLSSAFEYATERERKWRAREDFLAQYLRARDTVKGQLGACATSHSRLHYFKTMVEQCLGETHVDLVQDLCDAYWGGYFAEMVPDPDCRRVLDTLRGGGIKLAWVTNFNTERQMAKLAALGLAGAAHLLVSSEEAGAEKPDPRIVDLALARLGVTDDFGVTDDAVWVVGDSLVEDGGAARARGLRFVWFSRWCPADDPALPGEGIDHQVSSWAELGERLR